MERLYVVFKTAVANEWLNATTEVVLFTSDVCVSKIIKVVSEDSLYVEGPREMLTSRFCFENKLKTLTLDFDWYHGGAFTRLLSH